MKSLSQAEKMEEKFQDDCLQIAPNIHPNWLPFLDRIAATDCTNVFLVIMTDRSQRGS